MKDLLTPLYKNVKGSDVTLKYNQKKLDMMANNLEEYLDLVENYIIIDGISEEEYKDAVKTVKKLIKKLRKGKGDEVFDKERYLEALNSGELDI